MSMQQDALGQQKFINLLKTAEEQENKTEKN